MARNRGGTMLESKKTNRFFRYINRAKAELIVIAVIVFLDLLSKFLVSSFMELRERKTLAKDFLHFYYIKNPAAAFSFDFGLSERLGKDGMRIFFIVLMIAATIGFGIAMVRGVQKGFFYRFSLALIIGGALGNLYDRIFVGAVRDFVEIEYFGHSIFGHRTFAIFNLADSALVIGVILFSIYVIYSYGKEARAEDKKKKDAQVLKNQE